MTVAVRPIDQVTVTLAEMYSSLSVDQILRCNDHKLGLIQIFAAFVHFSAVAEKEDLVTLSALQKCKLCMYVVFLPRLQEST